MKCVTVSFKFCWSIFTLWGRGGGDLSSNCPKFTKICPFYCPHMSCFSKIFSDVTHEKCRAKVVDKNLMAFAQYEKHKMF